MKINPTPELYITGSVITREVRIGDEVIKPTESQKIINHTPDGFNWGYAGSGPSQLALAILLRVTTHEKALKMYAVFKSEIIARLPKEEDFSMAVEDVKKWIEGREVFW